MLSYSILTSLPVANNANIFEVLNPIVLSQLLRYLRTDDHHSVYVKRKDCESLSKHFLLSYHRAILP